MKITGFDVYRDLLKEKSGLVVTPDKAYLLESRLSPIAKKWNFDSLETMAIHLQGVPDQNLVNDVVEAMTTNETSFFRDLNPFERFKDFVIPYMLQSRMSTRQLNIWCAAASSGQEPYSLAMTLKEEDTKFSGWSVKILGTDISNDILAHAKAGVYSQFEVQRGLPIQLLMKYFTQEGDKWHISEDVKKMIKFNYLNLLDSLTSIGQFDVVFCRNVLIYFDEADKKDILERMASQLAPDGILFLGGAETVIGITDVFKPIPNLRGLYAKEGSVHFQKDAPNSATALA